MPNILLELLCEEIPARMQVAAMEHLKKAITNGLVDAGLTYEGAQAFVTPRRLALHVVNVPIATKPQTIERKGPRVGAPEGAIQGFLKSAGLAKIEDAELQDDGKGGQFYIAKQNKDGRPTAEVLQELVRETVLEFPWPKSMRWGSGTLNWVRPLHNICCTLSSETDVEVIDCSIENVTGKAETRGHTFLAPAPFAVKRFEDYVENLEKNYVVLDRERRKQIILADARTMAFAQGLELVEDQGLLEEIAGLVEWPVVLMGSFDEAFLSIPERVIQTTIRVNQKCFVLKQTTSLRGNEAQRNDEAIQNSDSQKETGLSRSLTLPRNDVVLANKFILVSNLHATDGGAAIIAGNERVIRARLSDAKFFWENDRKTGLRQQVDKLSQVVFHEKIGTQQQRVDRICALTTALYRLINPSNIPSTEDAHYAALLCKADLMTEMVGEFPELQGYMGKQYAVQEGKSSAIANAMEDHYKPRGPSEPVPSEPISIAVALADKLDTLVGLWAVGEKPTGSKDPYALRRSALGILRIVLENGLNLPVAQLVDAAINILNRTISVPAEARDELLSFFLDRMRVQFIEDGFAHDQVAAVLANWNEGDILTLKAHLVELQKFLPTQHGQNLLAGFRRANNILRAEEKKDGEISFEDARDAMPDGENAQALKVDLDALHKQAHPAWSASESLPLIAGVSQRIFDYIENTMINDPDPNIRLNRLRLLAYYRRLTRTVADFEKIEG